MRIARLLTRLNLGGPSRQVLASDPLLSARGHDIRVFAGVPQVGEGDLFETFEARWNTRHMVISGRSGAVEFEWDAVHKASGTPIKVKMVGVFKLASSGKFESVNFYFDTAKLGQYAVAASVAK